MSELSKSTIVVGSRVKLHFSITLENGMVAESSFDDEPVEILIGAGDLHHGLEQTLIGLRAGEKQRRVVPPNQGFGFRDPQAVQALSVNDFPKHIPLDRGVIVEFTTPGGDQVPGIILDTEKDWVKVDFNHPLADHKIIFAVEILEVSSP